MMSQGEQDQKITNDQPAQENPNNVDPVVQENTNNAHISEKNCDDVETSSKNDVANCNSHVSPESQDGVIERCDITPDETEVDSVEVCNGSNPDTNLDVQSMPQKHCTQSGENVDNVIHNTTESGSDKEISKTNRKCENNGNVSREEQDNVEVCDTGQGSENRSKCRDQCSGHDMGALPGCDTGSGDGSNSESPSILVSDSPHSMESQNSTASSTVSSLTPSPSHSVSSESPYSSPMKLTASGNSGSVTTDHSEDQLLSELDAELDSEKGTAVELPNGVRNSLNSDAVLEYKRLKQTLESVQRDFSLQNNELQRYKEECLKHQSDLEGAIKERDYYKNQCKPGRDQSSEDLFIIQTKELELSIARLEREVRAGKEKLSSHDVAAKRVISSLQTELKQQVDKARKLVEEATREKDNMVMKYAQAEQKNIELFDKMQAVEERMREMTKERESVIGKFKVLKSDRDKATLAFESRQNELQKLKIDIDKHKEATNSNDMKAKWHQNKLKIELEAHKDTKAKLEDYLRKLKEAKEEAEQIRRDCQAMIRTYQESEDIKSNSLDVQLKKKKVPTATLR